MKLRFALYALCLMDVFALVGCNGVGNKDSYLARIDNEVVYREDLALLMKNEIMSKEPLEKLLYERVYAKEAVVSKARTLYPELEDEWKENYQNRENSLLTMAYQRYFVDERLEYPESKLRQFYAEHTSLFENQPIQDFCVLQGVIASELFLAENQDGLNRFLTENLQGSTSREDSLKAKTKFIEQHRKVLHEELSKNVMEDLHYVINDLPMPDYKAYYEHHKDSFVTVPGYELYHVQGVDSLALSKLFDQNTDLDAFKRIAVKKSKNAETAKDSGYVGFVKKDYAMPHDIGMVPGLSASLENQAPGFVTPVLRSSANEFHVFYLDKVHPSVVKDFDRVEGEIKLGFRNGTYFEMDSSFVIMTKSGKPVLTIADLTRIARDTYMANLDGRNYRRLLSLAAEKIVFADAARKAKLEKSWEFRALVREAHREFITAQIAFKRFNDIKVSDDSIRTFFKLYGNPVHIDYDFDDAPNEVRAGAVFPMKLYKYEYALDSSTAYAGMTFAKAVSHIFKAHWREQSDIDEARFAAECYSSATLHFYDSSIPEYIPEIQAKRLVQLADSLKEKGVIDKATEEYRKLMYAYPENDSLFKYALYETAQMYNDAGFYKDAEIYYHLVCEMFPNTPEAEKSMFGRGFILNENLKNNDEAVKVLDAFLQAYPNSELKESAEWLVNNIKSHGKLADDLMKKISSEEN